MTEFQFLENLEFFQRRFETLHFKIVKDMNHYILNNHVYDSTFFNTVGNFSANITLTASWIKLLKDFNSDKYTNILRFSPDFNNSNNEIDTNIKPPVII